MFLLRESLNDDYDHCVRRRDRRHHQRRYSGQPLRGRRDRVRPEDAGIAGESTTATARHRRSRQSDILLTRRRHGAARSGLAASQSRLSDHPISTGIFSLRQCSVPGKYAFDYWLQKLKKKSI